VSGDTQQDAWLVSPVEPGADERTLARAAMLVLAAVSIPAVAIAYLVAGWQGAVSAALGLGFVLLLWGGSTVLLVRLARERRAGIVQLVLGSVARLVLYATALFLLSRVDWVHARSLAAATGLAIAVTLTVELLLMSRMPRLFWIDPAARPSTVVADAGNDTRSDTL
jgi:hypothetical protein